MNFPQTFVENSIRTSTAALPYLRIAGLSIFVLASLPASAKTAARGKPTKQQNYGVLLERPASFAHRNRGPQGKYRGGLLSVFDAIDSKG